jgi:thioredoxin reductase (NADPH)
MSDYLIKEIDNNPKIRVQALSHVVAVEGEGWLERVTLSKEAETETLDAEAMFIFIGAHPHTEWLPEEIARDRWGFILTGTDVPRSPSELAREPLLLETSLPGIFAAGDVRHGSLKRVAAAVAEGSTAIRLIHEHLERRTSEIGVSHAR